MPRADRSYTLLPRGLRAERAAEYLDISLSKFRELVSAGRLPAPKRIDNCVIWDRHQLDRAMDEIFEADHHEPLPSREAIIL